MEKLHFRPMKEAFPAWHSVTTVPSAGAWSVEVDWDDESFLARLLELVEDEMEVRFGQAPEEMTAFGAAVLEDLAGNGPAIVTPDVEVRRNFLRFFVSSKLVGYCQMYGRSSLVFDWLVCAISDRPWASVEPGQPLEVDYFPARLRQFVMDTTPVMCGTAPLAIISFVRSLYYYAWKSGGLRELAELVLEDAQRLARGAMERGDSHLVRLGVDAASALATWCLQGERLHATEVVQGLVDLYSRPGTPEEARKLVAVTLATSVGERTGQPRVEWARRAITGHTSLLVQHEPVQMLIASCATPAEMAEKYDEVIAAIERYTADCDDHCNGDPAEIAFRRIQLFDLFIPFVVGLVRGGHCSEAMTATAAWFSVPPGRRRRSPVLALLAGIAEGVMYAVDGRPVTYPHDSAAANRQLIEAVNHAFDMNIVVRDDHTFPARPKTGRRGDRGQFSDELAEATAAFYEIGQAADEVAKTQSLALFQPHTVHAPLVPLVRSRLGVAWPTVTSFEEPAADRPIRKALVWSYGTILGGHEARAVASVLEAGGVECVLLDEKPLTPADFLNFYNDPSFDLVWVTAHGMFDPREPHRAHIELSGDKASPMHLTELLRHRVRGPGRRLLFLNICLGASVMVTEAPPKLGLAAMLASAEQAVVSHIVEVSSFVAPLFGVAAAISIARKESFFESFTQALDAVRQERHEAVQLVTQAAPQCEEFLTWLRTGTYGVDTDDIRTWGTGAFCE
jgi:hypothetical protein